jgi:colanic acid biosynthesis glycosyl transferase WcaI
LDVLIITSSFIPDISPNARILSEISEDLVKQGHRVTVSTPFPYHPAWVVPEQYRWKLYKVEQLGEIKLIRTYVYASPKKTFITRMLNNVSIMVATCLGGLGTNKHDAALVMSPPLLMGITAYTVKMLKNTPFVLSVQDLYPETAIELGMLKNKYLINLSQKLEKFLYQKSDKIAVISDGFKKNLISKGIDSDKIEVIHNWVDLEFITPSERDNHIRTEYEIGNKFMILFAGTMGLAQGLDTIIESARLLRDIDDILFVFVGHGVAKERLISTCRKYALENVKFIPVQPRERIPSFLAAADVCLATLKRKLLFSITIPCKIYEIMSAGRPIVLGVDGDAKQLIEKANCGICVEPENPHEMADAIIKMYENDDLRAEYGRNGRNYVVKNHSRWQLTKAYERLLRDAANSYY